MTETTGRTILICPQCEQETGQLISEIKIAGNVIYSGKKTCAKCLNYILASNLNKVVNHDRQ